MKKRNLQKTNQKRTLDKYLFSSFFRKKDPGFTFIETLCVLALTAILTGEAGSAVNKIIKKARVTATRTQISIFQAALQSYYVDCGRFPTNEQGLKSLWEKPQIFPVPENWDGPYIEKEKFTDSWGTPIQYYTKNSLSLPEGTPEGLPYVLISLGADRVFGGEADGKDIYSWQ